MTTSFRQPFQVIQRDIGQVVSGKYYLSDKMGKVITVSATVQMPSVGDMNRIDTMPFGKRASNYIKIYTNTRLRCVNQQVGASNTRYAGDLFLYDGGQYLLFGESDFTMLARSRINAVSHYRYYACEVIEDADLDHAP